MSKIKNSRLDEYVTEPFKQQQFGAAGVKGVKQNYFSSVLGPHRDWRTDFLSQTLYSIWLLLSLNPWSGFANCVVKCHKLLIELNFCCLYRFASRCAVGQVIVYLTALRNSQIAVRYLVLGFTHSWGQISAQRPSLVVSRLLLVMFEVFRRHGFF